MRVVTHCFSGKQGLLRELGERERLRAGGQGTGERGTGGREAEGAPSLGRSHVCLGLTPRSSLFGASQVVQRERVNLPMQETRKTWIGSLGWEDPLEQKTGTHSSALTWKIPWAEEPGGLQSTGSKKH